MKSHKTQQSEQNPPNPVLVAPKLRQELQKLDACIHCGICLPACPTYLATGSEAESPRGRLYLMKKMLDGELTDTQVKPHLDQCLACHGCESVCPSAVQYGTLLMKTRQDLARNDRSVYRAIKRLIFSQVLPNHKLLQFLGSFLKFYQQSGLRDLVHRSNILALMPVIQHQECLMPAVPGYRKIPENAWFGPPDGEPVVLLLGCIMDIFYNPVHWDTIDVLVANDYRVHVPPAECCGALAYHAGEADITQTLAKQGIKTWAEHKPRWIVSNSAGCGSTLKEYQDILADDMTDSTQGEPYSTAVVDVMELLSKKPLAAFKNYALYETIAYHPACHLHHVQGVRQEPITLLEQIPGITLVPIPNAEACCGSAGIFNLEHPALSQTVLDEKIKSIETVCKDNGVTTIATGNPGCLLQIEHGVKRLDNPALRVRHPVSILADAYRRP
ncbi:MAG: (Fe-S)-binding protein [Cyanobacteria bacterium P01_H01_bin.74]